MIFGLFHNCKLTILFYKIHVIRPRPDVSVFVWKRNFFLADWPSVHTYPVKTVTENAPQSGKFWKHRFRVFVWTVKTELFENDDVTVLDPAYPTLQKDLEFRSTLSGVIPNRHFRGLGDLGPVQTPYLSCAVPNTFSLLGRIKRQALPYPEILACLIEICRKKLIWTPYNCQKTTYYLARHMRGAASELGLSDVSTNQAQLQ